MAALAEVNPSLRVGGPGSGGGLTNYLYKDFERLGPPGVDGFRLDYLSYHHKATPRLQRLARQVVEFQFALRAGEGGAGGGQSYLIFNDHGFLGDWGHRTQVTWFGDAQRFALVKKPGHNVKTLLALQGDEQLAVAGADLETPPPATPMPVRLEIRGLPFAAGTITHYRIDNQHGHTEAVWRELGMPFEPDLDQLNRLREAQEVVPLGASAPIPAGAGSTLTLDLELPLPAMRLVVLRAAPAAPLAAPAGLRAELFAGIVPGRRDVLLTWRAEQRGVASYRIETAPTPDGPWSDLPAPVLLAGSHVQSIPAAGRAWYRVSAEDDTGRRGPPSVAVQPSEPPRGDGFGH